MTTIHPPTKHLHRLGLILISACAVALLAGGCTEGPKLIPSEDRRVIDRHITEYPSGFELKTYIENLNAPSGICWDDGGNLIIAEAGAGGDEPHIFGIRHDGSKFNIYPFGTRIPFFKPGFRIYGPVGGICAYHGRILVSHRDYDDLGVITSFGYDGSHTTVVAGLPTQGDYGITDLAISPINGRLYFGIGAATNSGVVGLDNWAEGWVRRHRTACDLPYKPIDLRGYRFDAKNPEASIFSPETMVTVPFQPFGDSYITQIPPAPLSRPTSAIYSVAPDGGGLRVEAWGVRDPVGIAVNNAFGSVYFTDEGMELRGTRPILNDPDVLFQLVPESWYGWPDFSRSLEPISGDNYQLKSWMSWMILSTGYTHVGFVIDHEASKLADPNRRLILARFKPLSGASKMDFVPETGPFRELPGNLVIAMRGDRAPFATNHQPLEQPPTGYKIVLTDTSTGEVKDLIYNSRGGPASALTEGGKQALERPIDVKFGPDGNLYVVDFGYMRMKDGQERTADGTGKIFILVPSTAALRPH